MMRLGKLYIIAAPSGAGKTSLIKALLADMTDIQLSISHTTRPRRDDEKDGVDYHFISKETFQSLLADNIFLEHAMVFDHLYGTSRVFVEETLKKGMDVLLEIDWQGAQQVRVLFPQSVAIFILPPSLSVLEARLKSRAQDDEATIQKRLSLSVDEMSHYNEYDYLIINDDFDKALHELKTVIEANRLDLASQTAMQAGLLRGLFIDKSPLR